MPHAAPHLCLEPGCPELVRRGQRCVRGHGGGARARRQRFDVERDQSYRRLYRSKEWALLRAAQLAKQSNCEHCLWESGQSCSDRVVAAYVVDHIVPHRGDARLVHDVSNLQSLCRAHDDEKRIRENGLAPCKWHAIGPIKIVQCVEVCCLCGQSRGLDSGAGYPPAKRPRGMARSHTRVIRGRGFR